MQWSDFVTQDRASVDQVAAIQAMAAVFIRYLDAQKKLPAVYFAIREGRFPQNGAPRSDTSIVEEQMQADAATIDVNFLKWFQSGQSSAATNK
jgi:hypothetical protein